MNHLFFHSLAEIFSIIIASGLFMVVWCCRFMLKRHFLLLIGIGYLFIAFLDLLHTFSYKGLSVFPGYNEDLSVKFWIAARYLESLTLLAGPLFLEKKINIIEIIGSYILYVLLVLASIFWWKIFPICYIEGAGFTQYKIVSEYIICSILFTALCILFYHRKYFEGRVLLFLCGSIFVTIISELIFTFYPGNPDFGSYLGHILKIFSFYFLYKAIIQISLTKPYELMFRELKISEETFRNIYDTAPLAFVIWNSDRQVTHWNHFAEKIFGWTSEEVIGKDYFRLLWPDMGIEKADEMVRELFKSSSPHRFVDENYSKSGEKIVCEWDNSVLRDHGEDIGVLSIAHDITEQIKAEKALQSSSENIKKFAYSVAHDLKNPSISLYGLANRFACKYGDALNGKAKVFCDNIMKISEQIGMLVENINIFISTKELPGSVELINPKELFTVIREEFSPQVISRGISWLEPESIPMFRADRLAILRALRNIVDNALKYGGDYLREIRIDYAELPDKHILSISDDGVGIKEQSLERVFEFFNREDTSKGIVGSGLGLAIVKEIAKQCRGEVWVESEYGKGATFYISISKNL